MPGQSTAPNKTTHLFCDSEALRTRRSAWTPMILSMSRRIAFGCGRRGEVFHHGVTLHRVLYGYFWVVGGGVLPVYQKNTEIVISPWVYFHGSCLFIFSMSPMIEAINIECHYEVNWFRFLGGDLFFEAAQDRKPRKWISPKMQNFDQFVEA